jgi:hypothetical protein
VRIVAILPGVRAIIRSVGIALAGWSLVRLHSCMVAWWRGSMPVK